MMAKERPILFTAEMVRAILDGRKTQTRCIVKPQPTLERVDLGTHWGKLWCFDKGPKCSYLIPVGNGEALDLCPYGKPGDRLWVRETFQPLLDEKLGAEPSPEEYDYKTGRGYKVSYPATDGIQEFYDMSSDDAFCSRMTPSIHMPRWASRILLEITDVRVQRVQEISEEDAKAEGIPLVDVPAEIAWPEAKVAGMQRFKYRDTQGRSCTMFGPRAGFAFLWNSIHGAGAWERNEWVWAISFKRMQA